MNMENLNLLAKWRSIFASWQLGTRLNSDPEMQAVKDHRECTIIMRAEITALAMLLEQKGVLTRAEFLAAVENEAVNLMKDYENRFPGAKATSMGMDIDMKKAHSWMSRFPR